MCPSDHGGRGDVVVLVEGPRRLFQKSLVSVGWPKIVRLMGSLREQTTKAAPALSIHARA